MDIEALRPILSGLAGAGIAAWLLHKLSKWMPVAHSGRSIEEISHRQRWKVRGANLVAATAMLGGVALYGLDVFARNDWRGLGLTVGLVCVLPALLLVVASLRNGPSGIQEALVAYAAGQKTPPALLYGIWGFGTIVLFISVASLL